MKIKRPISPIFDQSALLSAMRIDEKIGHVIDLSESEQAICRYIAKKRIENAKTKNFKNRLSEAPSNWFTDLNGYGGEFAFCKLFNIMPDTSIVFSKKRASYDCEKYGFKIDVKTTHYVNGHLCLGIWMKDKEGANCFALMIGDFPKYEFKGFCSRERALSEQYIKDKGKGDSYFIPQCDLMQLEEMYLNDFL
jgi:hypothetical protein